MRFGLDVPVNGPYADPRLLAEMAAEAEAAGWDGFFLQDTLNGDLPAADPWISLAAVALATHRMRIGILVNALPRRRPWQVARQAATVDHLSGGRVVVGAGLGYSEVDFTPFGEEWDLRTRAAMLDEALDVLAGVWSGEPFSYAGRHYRLDGVTLGPAPVQTPRIPVWPAAGWPNRRPLARAARWDGVYLMTVHQKTGELLRPADIAEVVAAVAAQRAGQAFEVAFNAVRSADTAEQVGEFAAAGGTWWVELASDEAEGGLAAYRDRIRQGPPAV
ncbi:LLM class flavin-dependent oxidoreductase [Asanoa sp. WMMD1127]|uniref:LLM class flavin-dependent oxidoreductase n=1 Tax=Asanoa sp. WMMD1127 TaxID=3016107 RepID=UPI002417481A|nr:LLM class flavin-dependent oxidoreductase [Asanoa sp. WMMD1127]MDG4820598.1 LLM class flavin-dependent oxidoreductase [Asanoa sp. WMMD1127]